MWTVITTDFFDEWFDAQSDDTQEKVLAGLVALQTGGPTIGRPLVDTVNASKYNNMKELRVQHREGPIELSLLSILYVRQLYFVPVTKVEMKNVFTNK